MSVPKNLPIYHPQYQPSSSSSSPPQGISQQGTAPPPLTQELTYHNLLSRLRDRAILFRVHDSSSHSPLVWAGSPTLSGFLAANKNLHISQKAYDKSFGYLRTDSTWVSGAWMKSSMVDHLLSSSRGAHLKEEVPKDEMSPWISGTLRLDWAIWEVARRLANGQEKVHLTIIKQPYKETTDPTGHVIRSQFSPELKVWSPKTVLLTRGSSTQGPSEEAHQAARKASESFEVLMYGRVFAQSIEADLVWTKTHMPFELPNKFWQPSAPRMGDGWLHKLRWDPHKNDFEAARELMNQRVRMGFWQQPIHSLPPSWPPSVPPRKESVPAKVESKRVIANRQSSQDSGRSVVPSRVVTRLREVPVRAAPTVDHAERKTHEKSLASADPPDRRMRNSSARVDPTVPQMPTKDRQQSQQSVSNDPPRGLEVVASIKPLPKQLLARGTQAPPPGEGISKAAKKKRNKKRAEDLMGAEDFEGEAIAKLEASLINLSHS